MVVYVCTVCVRVCMRYSHHMSDSSQSFRRFIKAKKDHLYFCFWVFENAYSCVSITTCICKFAIKNILTSKVLFGNAFFCVYSTYYKWLKSNLGKKRVELSTRTAVYLPRGLLSIITRLTKKTFNHLRYTYTLHYLNLLISDHILGALKMVLL